jgi:glycerol-3-phosphate dehydrogenase (NAD(P)+)
VRLGVIGGGAWGTALAQVAAAEGEDVRLWAREPEVVEAINASHENTIFLKGVELAPTIRATGDLAELGDCEAFLIVAPAQHLRSVLGGLDAGGRPLVLCAKGIEDGTGLLMHEVARGVQPDSPIAVLSGPTFAHEVAAGLPTAVTLAVEDQALGERLVGRIARPHGSGPICPTTSPAPRSAARSRTCSPSPAAWSRAAGSARTPAPP